MNGLSRVTAWSEDATLRLARASQAAVLGAVDIGQRHCPGVVGRVVSTGLQLSAWLLEDPAETIARRYALVGKLVELHGEFAQRLLELTEFPAETAPPDDETG